jgi:hypothetical protein
VQRHADYPARDAPAKHCTDWIDIALDLGGTPYLAFGSDAWNPEQLVPITGYVAAPPSEKFPGLLLEGGRDAAVAYLGATPQGVQPAKVGHFEETMLGTKLEIAGYGYSDIMGTAGEKFVGTGTARALEGCWYELLFHGDKQAYLDWYWTDAVTIPTEEEAEAWWRIFRLEPGYELLAAGLPGESVGCYGDSGGPIFSGTSSADLTVYGVSFAVEASFSSLCALGNGYLVFNRKMLAFISEALEQQPVAGAVAEA